LVRVVSILSIRYSLLDPFLAAPLCGCADSDNIGFASCKSTARIVA
jgi:hypothetical protein